MDRYASQFDVLAELGDLPSQSSHPTHDRLAARPEPAAGEADRVTQLPEGSVIVEGFGGTRLPDCLERCVNVSELLEEAEGRVLASWWLDMIDELLELSPTAGDSQDIVSSNPDRPSDTDRRGLEPLPQAPLPAHGGPRGDEPAGQEAALRRSGR